MTDENANKVISNRELFSGWRIARNTVWNFSGIVAPLLVAVFTVPLLIVGMGKERFGLLSIIWMGVGYLSLFDMGLGRALTRLIAERLGKNQIDEMGQIIWTALWLMLGLGFIGALTGVCGSGPLVHSVLKVTPDLVHEGVLSFCILSCSLPIVILTSGIIGILEAHQKFAVITIVRIPMGAVTFLGPLITLQFSPSLVLATSVLVVTRTIALVVYFVSAMRYEASLRTPLGVDRTHLRPLFSFGGWLTVTNIVSPLMVYIDRFFIGAILSLTAVAYYTTPYDMLSRIQIVPQAIIGVLFPAFSAAAGSMRSAHEAIRLYNQSAKTLLFVMLPFAGVAFFTAPDLLRLWLGADFAIHATNVVRWICIGLVINSVARVPFVVLQSVGHPDFVAKMHLAEIIPYIAMLYFLTKYFGITGTAAAWTLRMVLDTAGLNAIIYFRNPEYRDSVKWSLGATLIVTLCFAGSWWMTNWVLRYLLLCSFGVIYLCAGRIYFSEQISSVMRKFREESLSRV